MSLRLFLKEVVDKFSQDNFKRLQQHIAEDPFDKGHFQFFTHTFSRAEIKLKIPHKLGFQPADVMTLSVRPETEGVVWHYDLFDPTNIVISSSNACTVRAYLGRYAEGQGQ